MKKLLLLWIPFTMLLVACDEASVETQPENEKTENIDKESVTENIDKEPVSNRTGVETQRAYGNHVKDFEMTNQHGEAFTLEDMEGKVWLADFVFTNCTTVCPPMTLNMTSVAQEIDAKGIDDFGIISFTVDPTRDDPETLEQYSTYYEIPEDTEWHFLTGYDDKFIRTFAETNFKTIVAPPPEGDDQYTHGTAFYLIDQSGKVLKSYSGVDFSDRRFPINEIVSDIEKLTKVN